MVLKSAKYTQKNLEFSGRTSTGLRYGKYIFLSFESIELDGK